MKPAAAIQIHRLRSLEEYIAHQERTAHWRDRARLLMNRPVELGWYGWSYPAARVVQFECVPPVNWREQLVCSATGLNNRARAALLAVDIEANLYEDSDVYLTEQTTPLYRHLAERFPKLVGSEFLGSAVPPGTVDARGMRNEDMTSLSFKDRSLDAILSFDVLEHIADFQTALQECSRCLRPGGRLIWSVPFAPMSATNIKRAVIENGEVRHLLEPEYHGDPLQPDGGVLCFTHFGWEMLTDAKRAGFSDAYGLFCGSLSLGHFGDEGALFIATK